MRLVSGLMAMTMTAMSLGMTAFAADDVTVKIGNDTKAAGAAYSVNVDLSGAPASGFSSIDFAINYDSSIIDVTDVSLGTAGKTGAETQETDYSDTLFSWSAADNQIIIVWATGLKDNQYWVKDGTFLTISGTVKADAKAGDVAKLEGAAVNREKYPGGDANTDVIFSAVVDKDNITNYTAKFTAGSVTVEGAGDTTTQAPISDIKWGDVDENTKVNVADAVLLARVAGGDPDVANDITAQGKANGDVVNDGSLNGDDTTLLLKYLASLEPYSALGKK